VPPAVPPDVSELPLVDVAESSLSSPPQAAMAKAETATSNRAMKALRSVLKEMNLLQGVKMPAQEN
jgi:hypothetical protein